ncbi:hypothetical protein GJ744_001009, partial [Endocarpon pusillum]
GKLPRTQLFKIHNVANRTGYRIIKERTARRSERIHNRGRKPVLAPHECEAIEAVEDVNFGFASSSHFKVAQTISLANGSERAIQRNMKDFGVGTYMAVQKKCSHRRILMLELSGDLSVDIGNLIKLRSIDGVTRAILQPACSDKLEFIVDQDMKHKMPYQRPKLSSSVRINQSTCMLLLNGISRNDYMVILEEIVAPEWDKDCVLVKDNDGPHGTKGKGFNKVKALKIRLGIQWEMNPPNSPDLNPIETIWRIIKQRLKSRGVIFEEAVLHRAIQEEWDKLTLDEINRAISTMPDRVAALNERNGRPIPY